MKRKNRLNLDKNEWVLTFLFKRSFFKIFVIKYFNNRTNLPLKLKFLEYSKKSLKVNITGFLSKTSKIFLISLREKPPTPQNDNSSNQYFPYL